ncbi:hypothetical protein [Streptomyces sp. TLI_185]|uniref:hypothetical protein n=1 Tax=Streptomyces sp. TLI_185 TaxID=2485151 RepID=UPI000FB58532|nr:hypothetical protein [Streptomyces sp. TLI_185]RPF31953.1 hypothetical protein EDD92_1823 [Streptomyces sp. TLI_185]
MILLLPGAFWKWRWVSLLPLRNEHLLRDLGGSNLAFAVVLCAAVVTMERRLVVTALVAYPTAGVPHRVFHAGHLEPLSAASGAGLMAFAGGGGCGSGGAAGSGCGRLGLHGAGARRLPLGDTDHRADHRPGGANSSS